MNWVGRIAGMAFVLVASAVGLEVVAARLIVRPAFNDQAGLSDAAVAFYRDHAAHLHHLRDLNDARWQLSREPRNAAYSVVAPFVDGQRNVLIQGDSWAEQFEATAPRRALESFAAAHGIGVVNAGTTSYAPSPMTVQIAHLRARFELHPTHVIAIIDQGDIGDELCRYAPRREFDAQNRLVRVAPEPFESNETYKLEPFFRKQAIFRSDDFALAKLAKAAALSVHSTVVRAPRRCPWPAIVRPLVEGVSAVEREDFAAAVRRYLDAVFADERVEFLGLVSHPHRGHLAQAAETPYVLTVAELLAEAIAGHHRRDRIALFDFGTPRLGAYLVGTAPFQSGDPASHLTDQSFAAEFTPRILAELAKHLR